MKRFALERGLERTRGSTAGAPACSCRGVAQLRATLAPELQWHTAGLTRFPQDLETGRLRGAVRGEAFLPQSVARAALL